MSRTIVILAALSAALIIGGFMLDFALYGAEHLSAAAELLL